MTRFRLLAAFGAVAALTLSACGGSDSTTTTPNAAPTDKVLHLSFLQDPGQPPDPDIFYAGQGLLLTTNTYEGLLQYKAGLYRNKTLLTQVSRLVHLVTL